MEGEHSQSGSRKLLRQQQFSPWQPATAHEHHTSHDTPESEFESVSESVAEFETESDSELLCYLSVSPTVKPVVQDEASGLWFSFFRFFRMRLQ